jgi:hypothetical protein
MGGALGVAKMHFSLRGEVLLGTLSLRFKHKDFESSR